MPDDKKKIFIDGLYSNEVDEKAPEWVLGKGSINVAKLGKFLAENANYAVNGYLDYSILRSKSGGRYVELDLYKFNNPVKANPETAKQFQFNREPLPIVDVNADVNVEDIPW